MPKCKGQQYHFVVQYNVDDERFYLDVETLHANFFDGVIYDTESGNWIKDTGDGLSTTEDYEVKENVLSDWLERINEVLKKEGENK